MAMVEHGSRLAGLNGLPVHEPAVSPREFTGTAALKRGIPPGAWGGVQILGMVPRSSCRCVSCISFTERWTRQGVLDDEGLAGSSFVQSRVELSIFKSVMRSGMSRCVLPVER